MNRRSFIKSGLGTIALGTTMVHTGAYSAEGKKLPIALQVYSVRKEAEKDLAGTLKKIAAAGYQGVEFAGYYNNKATDIRKMLDDNGLKAVSTHLGLGALLGDTFSKTVEFEKTLGNTNLIVSGGLDRAYSTDPGNQMTAHLFNELSVKAGKVGMKIGFHAHGGDFTKINGKTAWDLFFSRTRKEVIAQMDIGNCLACGADPYAAMAQFPGRGTLIHLKSFGSASTLVGAPDDKVDWKKVFELMKAAGTEWGIVEQEGFPTGMSPFEAIAVCLKNLAPLL